MLILGVDFETTGLDTANDLITEVGACLWDTDAKKPVLVYNSYVYHQGDDGSAPKPLTAEIVRLTGITDEDLASYGLPPNVVLGRLLDMIAQATYVVAHNGKGFDKPMLEAHLKRLGVEMPTTPWIDTDSDVPYPDAIGTRKLVYLAAEHGFVNPFAHRAIFDVLTMLRVLAQYDFAEVEEYAKQPNVTLRIMIPPPWEDGEVGNKKAKELGYRYNGATKSWVKTVKQGRVEKETSAAAPYRVVQSVV